MKRIAFIIIVTILGVRASLITDSFYGILLYTFYAFASPVELSWGLLTGTRISFFVAGTVIIGAIIHRQKIILKNRIIAFLILFLFFCYLSLAIRQDASPADWVRLQLLLRIGVIAIISAVLIDTPQKLRLYILGIAAFTGILGAYYGFAGLLAGSTSIIGPGRVGDNNGYSVWLNVSLPFIYYAGLQLKKLSWRYLAKIVFLGNILAVVLTFSRGGFITLLALLGLVFVNIRTKQILLFLLIPVAAISILFLSPAEYNEYDGTQTTAENTKQMSGVEKTLYSYQQRLMTLRQPKSKIDSAVSRTHFWMIAVNMANANPLSGVGFNRYKAAYNEYDTSGGAHGWGRAVHNTTLEILSETGYLGFLTFVFLILACLAAITRAKRISRGFSDPGLKTEFSDYCSMLRIGFVIFFLGSFFVNALCQEIFWAIVTLSLVLDRVAQAIDKGTSPETEVSIKNLSLRFFGR